MRRLTVDRLFYRLLTSDLWSKVAVLSGALVERQQAFSGVKQRNGTCPTRRRLPMAGVGREMPEFWGAEILLMQP